MPPPSQIDEVMQRERRIVDEGSSLFCRAITRAKNDAAARAASRRAARGAIVGGTRLRASGVDGGADASVQRLTTAPAPTPAAFRSTAFASRCTATAAATVAWASTEAAGASPPSSGESAGASPPSRSERASASPTSRNERARAPDLSHRIATAIFHIDGETGAILGRCVSSVAARREGQPLLLRSEVMV